MDRNPEQGQATLVEQSETRSKLQEESLAERRVNLPASTKTAPERDPFAYHQGDGEPVAAPKDQPRDPYTMHQGDRQQLPKEMQEEIQKKLAEMKADLDANNYSISIKNGEGPWNSIMRQRSEAQAKASKGQEVSPQEKALLSMNQDQILAESRRVRDRDFAVFTDDKGRPRNWYKTGEQSPRWTQEEVGEMMRRQEEMLVKDAQHHIAEQQRIAEEQKLAQQQAELERAQEAERQRLQGQQPRPDAAPAPAPVADRQALATEDAASAARQQQLDQQLAASTDPNHAFAKAINAYVPRADVLETANRNAGTDLEFFNSLREKIAQQVFRDYQAGALKPEDLQGKTPRIGAVFVGTDAVTNEELNAALAEQAELKKNAQPNQQVPRLGDLLRRRIPQERHARLDSASKFYDELKKLTEKPAEAQK